MLYGEVCGQVVRQVVGVTAGVSRTHRTDHLLQREGGGAYSYMNGTRYMYIHLYMDTYDIYRYYTCTIARY